MPDEFVNALIGGLLIGAAAALFVILLGRIAGISGIIGGLLPPKAGDVSWRVGFIGGLMAAPVLFKWFHALPVPDIEAGWLRLIAAGLLVGVGTRYGAGCTSGHGVCGIARLSPRSVIATLLFMVSGFATVFVIRHLIGG